MTWILGLDGVYRDLGLRGNWRVVRDWGLVLKGWSMLAWKEGTEAAPLQVSAFPKL